MEAHQPSNQPKYSSSREPSFAVSAGLFASNKFDLSTQFYLKQNVKLQLFWLICHNPTLSTSYLYVTSSSNALNVKYQIKYSVVFTFCGHNKKKKKKPIRKKELFIWYFRNSYECSIIYQIKFKFEWFRNFIRFINSLTYAHPG